jgi:hypothetical protein
LYPPSGRLRWHKAPRAPPRTGQGLYQAHTHTCSHMRAAPKLRRQTRRVCRYPPLHVPWQQGVAPLNVAVVKANAKPRRTRGVGIIAHNLQPRAPTVVTASCVDGPRLSHHAHRGAAPRQRCCSSSWQAIASASNRLPRVPCVSPATEPQQEGLAMCLPQCLVVSKENLAPALTNSCPHPASPCHHHTPCDTSTTPPPPPPITAAVTHTPRATSYQQGKRTTDLCPLRGIPQLCLQTGPPHHSHEPSTGDQVDERARQRERESDALKHRLTRNMEAKSA